VNLSPAETPSPTPLTPAPPSEQAESFYRNWEAADYGAMYELLSIEARQLTSPKAFMERYEKISYGIELRSLAINLVEERASQNGAEVDVAVIMDSGVVGRFQYISTVPMVWENDDWWVDWSPRVIFPQLDEDELVSVYIEDAPRGDIYDRNGQPLATYRTLITVGVIPGLIEDEDTLLAQLGAILEVNPADIAEKYAEAPRMDWFIPIKVVPFDFYEQHRETLQSLPGAAAQETHKRYYSQGMVGSQLVGYVGPIDADELAERREQGYTEADLIGKKGMEWWGEPYLAGKRGGEIRTVTSEGQVRDVIVRKRAVRGRDLHSTLDVELQARVEEILGTRKGAIVLLDPRNGDVLAMASYPSFDPNQLMGNDSSLPIQNLLSDPGAPLLNRCTQSAYPLGSVFKIVTMATALEELGATQHTPFHCTGIWQGLGSQWSKTCWDLNGHGDIDLFTGLVKSCDVVFYELGMALDRKDPELLPSYALQFGLGQATGLSGAEEVGGLIPNPEWKKDYFAGTESEAWLPGDTVNVAIGQGYVLVTPLQAAELLASVGNGGTIWKPRLVYRIAESVEESQIDVQPDELGSIPVSQDNLTLIQQALTGVTSSSAGTAAYQFEDANFTSAGKTGTAETPQEEPHAWFVGYTPAENPSLVVAVIIENAGEGSKVAAPIFREAVESYLELENLRAGGPTPTPQSIPTEVPE
jgi:penicillin-binding protein 2